MLAIGVLAINTNLFSEQENFREDKKYRWTFLTYSRHRDRIERASRAKRCTSATNCGAASATQRGATPKSVNRRARRQPAGVRICHPGKASDPDHLTIWFRRPELTPQGGFNGVMRDCAHNNTAAACRARRLAI